MGLSEEPFTLIFPPMLVAIFFILLFGCRPILVLPPADIQVIYCELTEPEKDFYDALFKRSKVILRLICQCICFLTIPVSLTFFVFFGCIFSGEV